MFFAKVMMVKFQLPNHPVCYMLLFWGFSEVCRYSVLRYFSKLMPSPAAKRVLLRNRRELHSSRCDAMLVHHRYIHVETNLWRVALSLTNSSIPFARSSCLRALLNRPCPGFLPHPMMNTIDNSGMYIHSYAYRSSY